MESEGSGGNYVANVWAEGIITILSSECKTVDNDDILNNLKDILLDFASIWEWVKENWYWVLGGFTAVGK
jgi:hypothetical protein